MPKLKRGRGISQSSLKNSLKRARIRGSQRDKLYRSLNIDRVCAKERTRKQATRKHKIQEKTQPQVSYFYTEMLCGSASPQELCSTEVLFQLRWVRCEHCNAEVLNSESPGFCCGKNENKDAVLITLPPVPNTLQSMYDTLKDLQNSSRKYNNLFSMSAIGATGFFEKKPTGVSNLILHGRTYHRMLNGNDDTGPLC